MTLARLRQLIDLVVGVLDYRQRRRLATQEAEEKRLLAEAANRESQLELLEAVLTRVQSAQSAQTEAVIELARAQQAQAAALQTWFQMFQQHSIGDGATHTVRPADEAVQAESAEYADLLAKGYPVGQSPDAQLAWLRDTFPL